MIFSKKILSVTILILLALSVYLFYSDQNVFAIKSATVVLVEGELPAPIKEKVVIDLEDRLSEYRGRNIWRLALDDVSKHLKKNRLIKTVRVSRQLPHAIHVSVILSEIVFIYVDKKKRLIPVTKEGYLLRNFLPQQIPDVPVLRDHGLVGSRTQLKRLIELYNVLPAKGRLSQSSVTEVFWEKGRGLKIELSGYEGRIILGEGNIKLRIKRVVSVLKYLESQKQEWRVIDGSFSKKVLVRLRKHS